jgi:hypothetical protein
MKKTLLAFVVTAAFIACNSNSGTKEEKKEEKKRK